MMRFAAYAARFVIIFLIMREIFGPGGWSNQVAAYCLLCLAGEVLHGAIARTWREWLR